MVTVTGYCKWCFGLRIFGSGELGTYLNSFLCMRWISLLKYCLELKFALILGESWVILRAVLELILNDLLLRDYLQGAR